MLPKKIAISSILLLSACDVGGLVEDYTNLPAQEIKGYCASACTMKLLNGCVYKDTLLQFHGPTHYGLPLSDRDFEYWSRVISSHYPEELREWYMSEGRYTNTFMTGEEVIEMGARECLHQN